MMAWTGLALLVLVGVGIVSTGLPAAVVLIAVAICGAILGVVAGAIDVATLGALPSRLINLLENDLLQALPLYVTMGLLLDRLPVADALYRASNAVLPRKPSAPLVSGMMLGALLGPMNGSVGASVLGLSRVVSPRLAAEGIPAPNRHAIVAVASTLGVLVPPSLVLILLSDAMLSAPHARERHRQQECRNRSATPRADRARPLCHGVGHAAGSDAAACSDVAGIDELHDGIAERDLVAVSQARGADAPAVDPRAIPRPFIDEHVSKRFAAQHGVTP